MTLYKLTRTGKLQQWDVEVGDGFYTVTHGQVDGKQQSNTKSVKGKNIGRSNETTPQEQAVLEAESLIRKKRDEGYVDDPEKATVPRLPMLAHPYAKRKHNLVWPVLVQPKLDGIRCIATRKGDTIEYKSRGDKEFTTLDHLTPELLGFLKDGECFDGELYIHGLELRHIGSLVKKHRGSLEDGLPNITPDLEYWVYDMPSDDPFVNRYGKYMKRINNGKRVRSVESVFATNETEMLKEFAQYIEQGFEGIIIRNTQGKYAWGFRSVDLQKYKEFIDAEYRIVYATTSERGQEEGCVIWVCETPSGNRFNVRPRGTREEKRDLYTNRNEYIGKQLTVRYQTLIEGTEIPQFGVGVAVETTVRDYE